MDVLEQVERPVEDDLRLVTLGDAAEYLSISRGAVYTLLRNGQMASVHIGRARRIPMAELHRFVRSALAS
jgi:excisionase family DNA binding protein